jgi:glycerol-3-phosphate dehydrogenase (NAD(P)+)
MKTAVLGSGSWGTALAAVLAENGHETCLWARNHATVEEVERQHRNSKYLGQASLPFELKATTDLGDALAAVNLVIVAVPSVSVREVARAMKPLTPKGVTVAHAVKGFDPKSLARMSDVIREELDISMQQVCVISGPSHAEEVVAKQPTTIVSASTCKDTAEFVQDALMSACLRVYTNPDVVGAELGGSLKNIIALGVGIIDGLGIGDNARAALMTRGLAEITRLGVKMGASPLTFAGLSGIGDLIVTCTSRHSRNFRTGRLLGQGATLVEALARVGMAVEGVHTTRAAVQLAERYATRMPIAESLFQVLFNGLSPRSAAERLMQRERIHEIEEVAQDNLTLMWEA